MKKSQLRRFIGAFALATAGILIVAGILAAHDFWLVPNAFAIADGGTIEVRGQTSSKFPTSESAVVLNRVADARVIGASSDERIGDLSIAAPSLMLRHRPTGAGQRIVAIALHPTTLRASGPGFKRYMELEGAAELAARYDREGILPKTDSITRRYVKFAKTFVEVGQNGPRAFSRVVGHVAEFVPLADPAKLRAGDTLALRLLYRGSPLASTHIHAGRASDGGAEADRLSLTTDQNGIVRVPVANAGLWNARTLHIVPAERDSGADWDSYFVTVVFSVGGASAPASGAASSDSAAAANVVTQYHAALSAGDSAAALRLLADDAVILESGGMETRDHYRAGHLPADIRFASAVPAARGPMRVVVRGDVAWVTSTSTSQGEYRGRQINSSGAELMVLSREPDGWKIRAIHWSSRTRRPPPG